MCVCVGGDWESAHYSEASGREEHRLGSSHNGSRATVQREDGEEEEVCVCYSDWPVRLCVCVCVCVFCEL